MTSLQIIVVISLGLRAKEPRPRKESQGCHWTFAKITENLRVRAVSQKMNTKRNRKFRKRKMKQEKIENINIHFRQTEQLGEKRKTGNGSAENGSGQK